MLRKITIFALFFVCVTSSRAQSPTWQGNGGCGTAYSSDPLRVGNFPTIDQTPGDYPANVWVTDEMQKVYQDAGNTPGNVKWAFPCGSKNEFVSFQVHYKDSGAGSTLNSMTISNLTGPQPATTTTITNSGSPANITVYGEKYYNIQIKSDANSTGLGHAPDILVPVTDPYRAQSTNIFPITVAANQTQSVLFDIFIPPTTPSGFYQGTVTVTVGGSTLTTLPVVLSVWNFSLPSTSSLQSMYGGGTAGNLSYCALWFAGSNHCSTYPGAGSNDNLGVTLADVDLAVIGLDHRISSGNQCQVDGGCPNSPPNTWTHFNTYYGPLLNGTAANTSTILSGAKLTSFVYMGCSNSCGMTTANLNDWWSNAVTNSWNSVLYAWSIDEPTVCGGWNSVNTNATTFQAATTPFPSFTTSSIAKATTCSGLNSVDRLVAVADNMQTSASSASLRSTYNTWLQGHSCAGCANRSVWMYHSCDQQGTCVNGVTGPASATAPDTLIDQTALRNRLMQWVEYLNGVSGDLYYATTQCWTTNSCQDGNGTTDPCTPCDPWTYIYFAGGNGDGTLIYQGSNAKIGVTNPIYLPSVRLKLIRDGYQDWEYMNLLDQNGQHTFMQNQLTSVASSIWTLTFSTTTFQTARAAMGNRLHSLVYQPALVAPARAKGRLPI